MLGRRPLLAATAMITPGTSSAAPRYMSRLAFRTERGCGTRSVLCPGPVAGYGSYITTPPARQVPACDSTSRSPPGRRAGARPALHREPGRVPGARLGEPREPGLAEQAWQPAGVQEDGPVPGPDVP